MSDRARGLAAAGLVLGCLGAAACAVAEGPGGEGPGAKGRGAGRPPLTVSAAASLSHAFERYGAGFEPARVRLSLAGSDELAAQVRRGARPDVLASADPALLESLSREGRVERPVTFAGNRLVLAVPRGSPVDSLVDLERPGVRLVAGSPRAPVGRYTRALLARLGGERERRILARVRSEEPDVRGVVAKLSAGAADAGFVYRSDVAATGGRLRAIELPARLGTEVSYAAATVRGARRPGRAREFIAGLRSGRGRAVLRRAGLGPPPR